MCFPIEFMILTPEWQLASYSVLVKIFRMNQLCLSIKIRITKKKRDPNLY